MQSQQASAHPLRFFCPDAQPEQMHPFCECARVGEDSVVVCLGVQFPVSKHQHSARSTKSANVSEQIEMIQSDLERLHPSHGKSSHGAVITIGERAER